MIIIACVDDNMGMMFNHRRQSQDQVLSIDLRTGVWKLVHMEDFTGSSHEKISEGIYTR